MWVDSAADTAGELGGDQGDQTVLIWRRACKRGGGRGSDGPFRHMVIELCEEEEAVLENLWWLTLTCWSLVLTVEQSRVEVFGV